MKFTVLKSKTTRYVLELTCDDIIGMASYFLTTTGKEQAIEAQVHLDHPQFVEVRTFASPELLDHEEDGLRLSWDVPSVGDEEVEEMDI